MDNNIPAVVASALEKAEKLLRSTGVQYQIRYPDGKLHGNMQQMMLQFPEKESKRRRKLKHAYGTLTQYIKEYLKEDVPVGTVISIPISHFGFGAIQSTASARAGQLWGNGNYTSCRNRITNSIELMRNG